MNKTTRLMYIAFFVVLVGATRTLSETADETTVRTWTSKSGHTIEAAFERMQFGIVYLKKNDGTVINISRANLSLEDREKVTELTALNTSKSGKTNNAETKKAPDEIYKLFGADLKDAKKKSVSIDNLSDKIIGVYFSAHWCPPCRAFTPKLVEVHNSLSKDNKPFEIVFVSSDRSKKAMFQYMKEMKMPWLALPHGDKHKNSLAKKYNVRGIPKLVILSPSGKLITENGRGEILKDGVSAFDKWKKQTN